MTKRFFWRILVPAVSGWDMETTMQFWIPIFKGDIQGFFDNIPRWVIMTVLADALAGACPIVKAQHFEKQFFLTVGQNVANLTQRTELRTFFPVCPKYSTELSTEFVDNANFSQAGIRLSES